jgi:hypothetical protein
LPFVVLFLLLIFTTDIYGIYATFSRSYHPKEEFYWVAFSQKRHREVRKGDGRSPGLPTPPQNHSQGYGFILFYNASARK